MAKKCKKKGCKVKHNRNSLFCSMKCYRDDSYLTKPRYWMYWASWTRAKEKGFEFTLTYDDIPEIPEYCPVFPWMKLVRPTGQGGGPRPNAPSIDRIDNDLGYVPGNIRIISCHANELKSNATIQEVEAVLKDMKRIEETKKKK